MRTFPTLGFQQLGRGWLGDGVQQVGAGTSPIHYLLQDDFTDTVAAGSVNGTLATPTGGARTVTDTESKLSVGSGVISGDGGKASPAYGDPGLWYPALTRALGRTLVFHRNQTSGSGPRTAFSTNTSGTNFYNFIITTGETSAVAQISNDAGSAVTVASITRFGDYYFAIVLRTVGNYYFIKGGSDFPNWTLLYRTNTRTDTPVYPSIGNYSGVFTQSFMRVPQDIFIPPVAAYDLFTRANGALGSTPATGPDSQAFSALAWSNDIGTSQISSNAIITTVLAGGIAAASVTVSTADVVAEISLTRGTGSAGLLLRYVDTTNYAYCVHNGTNLQLVEVIAGTPNTLVNAAATYSAGKPIVAVVWGNKARVFYNGAAVGTEKTLNAALANGVKFGWYSTDTDSTGDMLVVMARGTGGEYNSLNRFLAGSSA